MSEKLKQKMDALTAENPESQKAKQASTEHQLWENLQMVAHQKGKSYDGVMSVFYPHMLFQLEGSRAISVVSISDAPRLCILTYAYASPV